MISKDDMMSILVAACPTFGPSWRAFVEEWLDEPVELPLYVALGVFVRHLASMLERDDAIGLSAAFQAIETLHVEGDPYVREAATIGILESLQNVNEPKRFLQYLGPESRKWWDKLDRFWNGDATALLDCT